jgi:hypothetical protein
MSEEAGRAAERELAHEIRGGARSSSAPTLETRARVADLKRKVEGSLGPVDAVINNATVFAMGR